MRTTTSFLLALVALFALAIPAVADHDASLHDNMTLIGQATMPGATDVELTDDGYAIQVVNGSSEWAGLWVVDVSDPTNPQAVSHLPCAGSGYDVGLWNDIAVMSIDSASGNSSTPEEGCNLDGTVGEEGIRLVDVSDRQRPVETAFLPTDCGSHTNITFDHDGRGLVYVQSYPASTSGTCPSLHGLTSVVDITDPHNPEVVAQPSVLPAVGCHDGAIHGDYAYMACLTEGQIWDITDPLSPVILAHMYDVPDAVWHSTDVSNDGTVAAFGWESFQSGAASCASGSGQGPFGAIWFYDVTDPSNPVLQGAFSPELIQLDEPICTAHNFTVLPDQEDDILVTGWYGAGIYAVDFTDPTDPSQLGFFKNANGTSVWHANYREGYVYAGDGNHGLDVYVIDSLAAAAPTPVEPNPAPDPPAPPSPDPLPSALPVTGGGLALLGLLAVGAAVWLRRR